MKSCKTQKVQHLFRNLDLLRDCMFSFPLLRPSDFSRTAFSTSSETKPGLSSPVKQAIDCWYAMKLVSIDSDRTGYRQHEPSPSQSVSSSSIICISSKIATVSSRSSPVDNQAMRSSSETSHSDTYSVRSKNPFSRDGSWVRTRYMVESIQDSVIVRIHGFVES